MKETMAFFAGFIVLVLGGRGLYVGYSKICAKLAGRGPAAQNVRPAAMMLTGFSITTLFILLIMVYTVLVTGLELTIGSFLMAGLLILLLDNAFIYASFRYSQHASRQKLSQQLMLERQHAEEDYYRALEEQYNRQRVLIHDIRKHLGAIRDLAGEGAVSQYVEELERSPALQNKVRICGNHTLDVVLCRYKEVCQAKGIGFSADVRDHAADFLLQSDVTSLFGNLLENAVEAAEGVEEAYLELLVDKRPGSRLLISLVNSCREAPVRDGMGGFVSRKADRERHGLGIRSIRGTVERYGGTMQQYYNKGTEMFHTVILLH